MYKHNITLLLLLKINKKTIELLFVGAILFVPSSLMVGSFLLADSLKRKIILPDILWKIT